MGLQFGYECRCGDLYGKYGQVADSECATQCADNRSEICGDGEKNSIYEISYGIVQPCYM